MKTRDYAKAVMICAAMICSSTAMTAKGGVITQWNFNSSPADASSSTGSTTPSVGSGTATNIGGTTASFATGSPGDPAATDNTGWNLTAFPAQSGGSGTGGAQFAESTVGADPGAIVISLDFRQSGTASRFFQLQASSDGTTFANVSGGTASIGTIGAGNTLTTFDNSGLYTNNAGGGTQTFVQAISYTFPSGSAFEADANFAFRFVSVFDPTGANPGKYISSNAGTSGNYSASGTARFDEVTVSSTPEPASAGLLVAGGLVVAGFRRRRAIV